MASIPDHLRVGAELYYLTWPRVVTVCVGALLAVMLLTSAPEYLADDPMDDFEAYRQLAAAQAGSNTVDLARLPHEKFEAVSKIRKARRTRGKRKAASGGAGAGDGVVPAFCEAKRSRGATATWHRAVLGSGEYPAYSDEADYCSWKPETATAVPFKMCTFDPAVDNQISAFIHREGHWSAYKKEVFERILPVLGGPKFKHGTDTAVLPPPGSDPFPGRDLVIDVGANIGFYTTLFAMRGYDVIALEPSVDAITRMLYTLDGNGITVATKGGQMGSATGGRGGGRSPVVHVFQDAASDNYGSLTFHYVADNPGASWVNDESTGGTISQIATVPIDDALADEVRDPSAGRARPAAAPVIDPSRVRAIKISAEGMDSRVVSGMRRLIRSGRPPFIVFVYNRAHVSNQECDPDGFIKGLFDAGYRIYHAGVYIYRERELARFLKGMNGRSTELLFVAKGAAF